MTAPKNIMIIDDHPLIHDGLETLLSTEPDLDIRMKATSAKEAFALMRETLPDVAIIDLSLGDSDGTYLIQRLRKLYRALPILVYTMSDAGLYADRVAQAGANGFVMKTSPPPDLKAAIRAVARGESFFPALDEGIKKTSKKGGAPANPSLDNLSNREMDIFQLIGEGLDSSEMAERLSISKNTVDTHRINIKNKLELPNGKALDRLAFEVIKHPGKRS